MPAMSVVVICFDDARHLPAAVRSATGQSLRDLEVLVIDDGSRDGTPGVAAELAAADSRVRYHRLDTNSGGCSRPRNVGMSLATGEFVTFLDSDDVLPRQACLHLLRAARRTGADVVCGRWVRRHHDPTRFIEAHRELYRRPEVIAGIAQRPQQLFDTPAPAKLYRRDFLEEQGLTFPEGLLYEDLLFTTEAYLSARCIAVIPRLVYVWNVRRKAEMPSITNRVDLRNWRDRFEVHRRIDARLAAQGATDGVVSAKHAKFLAADFTFFLRELRQRSHRERAEMLELAQRYVVSVGDDAWPEQPVSSRVAAVLAARADLPRVLAAADYAITGGVRTDLTVAADRLLWTAAHPEVAQRLDVTTTGLLNAPFTDTPFLATVCCARWTQHELAYDGVLTDVLGRLGDVSGLTGRLLVSGRVGGVLRSAPMDLGPDQDGVRFEGRLDLRALGRSVGRPTVGHELRLAVELRRGSERVVRPLSARDADLPDVEHRLPTPWRPMVGDRVRLTEANGRLVLQLTALPRLTESAVAAGSWVRYVARQAAARLRSS